MIAIGKRNIYLSVTNFKGQTLIHLRKHTEDNDKPGTLYPSKIGVCLTEEEFNEMKKSLSFIDNEIEKAKAALREANVRAINNESVTTTPSQPPMYGPYAGPTDSQKRKKELKVKPAAKRMTLQPPTNLQLDQNSQQPFGKDYLADFKDVFNDEM